ncbi:MAG: gliding motility protein GldL, partial [Bacteroidota bacterium]
MAAAIPPKVGKIVDVFVSIAAAIVIWGALRKILHAPDADMWLKIGLTTEALVFLVYGILYLKYPAIDEHAHLAVAKSPNVLGSLDKAMLDADITPTNLNRLGEGFKKLNSTISNMNDITDVVAATGDYTQKTKEVTVALNSVKEAYVNAASSVGAFNAASDGARVFH